MGLTPTYMHRHFNKVLGGIDTFPGKQLLIVFASLLKRGLLKKGNNLEQISHKSCIPYKRWRKKYQPSGHTTLKQRRLNFDRVLMKQRRCNLTLTGRFFYVVCMLGYPVYLNRQC